MKVNLSIILYLNKKFDFKDIIFLTLTMEQIGKPIEVNRQFIKFIEEDIEPEYNRVFEMLLQKLKDELDQQYTNEGKILKKEDDNKYKNGSNRY
jgi:hypothetical protein